MSGHPFQIAKTGQFEHHYIENPDKTEQGQFVSSYACSALTTDEEFMLTKRQYDLVNGRRQKSEVIAYQIRQSFRPGEITAEEANKVGYELAMRFTKGKYAFVVATHTDRQHIHNHVIFNSTALDGTRKFRDFFFSALAVQRLSDLICLEHQLSVIEKKPYRERQKRIVYLPKESNRDRLCGIIDTILAEKPGDYETFLQKLEQQGYEVKRGKHTAVKGARQKRFIRFRTLGTGYGENEIKAVLEGKAEHKPYQRKPPQEQSFQLLVDIQGKMTEGKSVGYKKWATKFNLKEMSKTLLFLQEQKIGSAEELRERAAAATEKYHAMGYFMLIYLAALQDIPSSLYEAASIDGASKWRQFRSITFPMLTPSHFFVFIMLTINSFKTFDLIFALTEGGPGTSTTLLSMYIYNQSFISWNYGSASAAAIILLLIVGSITLFQFKAEKKFNDFM